MSMCIALGSDHAGFLLKEDLKVFLANFLNQVQFQDVGTYTRDPVDYPDYTEAVANCVLAAEVDRRILICGSGEWVPPSLRIRFEAFDLGHKSSETGWLRPWSRLS
jgi:Ribose/Galactose Isomerase